MQTNIFMKHCLELTARDTNDNFIHSAVILRVLYYNYDETPR